MNSSEYSLVFRAGASAFREIQSDGLNLDRIGTLAGASGGAKWLVLSQLDRVLARRVLPELRGTVHTIGTSIGAWRFACHAQADPVAAIERFEEAYLTQSYSEKPDRAEITQRTREILDYILADDGVEQILNHPVLHTSIMTVRGRGLLASENRALLGATLAGAAAANAVNRHLLGWFFERVLFHDPRDQNPFADLEGFPMRTVPLAANNLKQAIAATGSIPLVLEGVANIPGAPRGMYRDGGVIDYHLDFPHAKAPRLALYLHFYDFLKPGWFDKALSWREALPHHSDRTILVSPSPAFVAKLPNGKIPDRSDFVNFQPAERVRIWRETVAACEEMAAEFEEVLANDRLAERLQTF